VNLRLLETSKDTQVRKYKQVPDAIRDGKNKLWKQ